MVGENRRQQNPVRRCEMQHPGEHCSLSAFGLDIEADFPLPGAGPPREPAGEPKLVLQRVEPEALRLLDDEPRYLRNLQAYDGSPFAMLEGSAGDILFLYGHRAVFHLSADHCVLRCAAPTDDDRTWQRVLLDTVLWTVSLLRGFELLHASAVETAIGVVAFVASTGSGKTSLAAEYLRRGALLFSDDIVALDDRDGAVVAYPGPPLMNIPSSLEAESLGETDVLAHFGDEKWVNVNAVPRSVQSLSAIVLIDRVEGEAAECVRMEATNLTLLPYAVALPHLQHRARRRFELFGAVAATTTMLRLRADPSVPPPELADLVEPHIESR